jgi:hypothetical protein
MYTAAQRSQHGRLRGILRRWRANVESSLVRQWPRVPRRLHYPVSTGPPMDRPATTDSPEWSDCSTLSLDDAGTTTHADDRHVPSVRHTADPIHSPPATAANIYDHLSIVELKTLLKRRGLLDRWDVLTARRGARRHGTSLRTTTCRAPLPLQIPATTTTIPVTMAAWLRRGTGTLLSGAPMWYQTSLLMRVSRRNCATRMPEGVCYKPAHTMTD